MGLLNTLRNYKDRGNEITLKSGKVVDKSLQHEFEDYEMEIERTPNYDKRVMFYKKGCEVCPKWKKAIRRVNMRMNDPKNRIAIVELGGLHPLYKLMQPESAPEVWLDGVVIRGATSTEGQVGFLEGFLSDAIDIGRSSDPGEISAISRAVKQAEQGNRRY